MIHYTHPVLRSFLACILMCLTACNDDGGRQKVEDLLLADKRIENVDLGGFWENDTAVFDSFSLVEASFQLANRPDTRIYIKPYSKMYDYTPHLTVYRIGDHKLWVSYETQESGRVSTSPDFGCDGAFAALLPVRIQSIDDLIENYDLLEAYLATWPEYPQTATLSTPEGRTITYHRE